METITNILDEDQIDQLQSNLCPENTLIGMSDIFKILSDPSRLKIVMALLEDELCVGDLSIVSGFSQSSVSHHLKTLRQMNLVKFHRKGKHAFYRLADSHVSALVAVARDHARETE